MTGPLRPPVPAIRARDLVAWLAPEHRNQATALLRTGRRLAQAAVGLAHLLRTDLRTDGWRDGFNRD